MKENKLIELSKMFAGDIVNLCTDIKENRKGNVLVNQLLRSGTSIGANINEANYGQSKADFISKMHIALKETAETEYWLRLLILSEYISEKEGESLLNDCLEIKRILVATLNTAKNNNK